MRLATSDRLSHMQLEYNGLNEQTAALKAQYSMMNAQCQNLLQYCQSRPGDRVQKAALNQQMRAVRSLYSHIVRNERRMAVLQRNMAAEMQRQVYNVHQPRRRRMYW